MNEAEEDAKLRDLYVPYASTDPLWLDLARAGERLLLASHEIGTYETFEGWVLALPPRHALAIGHGWKNEEAKQRLLMAAVCLAVAEIPMHKRNTFAFVRIMERAQRLLYEARNPNAAAVRRRHARQAKMDKTLDALTNANLDSPLRLRGDITMVPPTNFDRRPPRS